MCLVADNYGHFHRSGNRKKPIPTVSSFGDEIHPFTSASVLSEDKLGDHHIEWETSGFKLRNVIPTFKTKRGPSGYSITYTHA